MANGKFLNSNGQNTNCAVSQRPLYFSQVPDLQMPQEQLGFVQMVK